MKTRPPITQSYEIVKSNGLSVGVGVLVGVGVGVLVGVDVGSGKVLTTFNVAVLPVTVTSILLAPDTNGATPVPLKVKKN